MRVGEVTDTTAIVWTRLTRHRTRNNAGVVFAAKDKAAKGKNAPAEPVPPVAEIEGAYPAMAGRVRVRYGLGENLHDATETPSADVNAEADGIHQFKLTSLKPGATYHYISETAATDGSEKTIWGAEQKAWFKRTVKESTATWKVLVSPTPLVGPDRASKHDNHSNDVFAHEGDELRAWLQANAPENFFVVCGDRHWQYHSVHPATGVQEFSVGPARTRRIIASTMKSPLVLALLLSAFVIRHSSLAVQPNVLILLADDLGYADIGVQGGRDIPTPHIDSIARNGVRCTSGYVSSCMCSPSRAGLMTGRSQSRFGHEINWEGNGPSGEKGLPLTEKTFPQLMKASGYRTGVIGKWHLGNEERFHPLSRGFDEFFGFLGGSHDYLMDWRPDNLLQRNHTTIGATSKTPDDSKYLTTVLGNEAAAFIHRNKDVPWFLYVPFNAPHTPKQATAALLARFAHIADENRRTYAAMVSGMDDAIGTVLEQLRKDGIEENTLIVFLSDNGGPLERNGSLNTPLSGEKGTMFEGGIRVPFLVQWKAKLPAGKTYDRAVSSLDLLPTALAIAEIKVASASAESAAENSAKAETTLFDGVNLIPFLTGERSGDPHDFLFWRMSFRRIWAVRAGDDKIVMQAQGKAPHPVSKTPRLINLASDVKELTDLTAEKPERAKEFRARYDAWNATLPEPLWKPEKGDR